MLWLIGCSLPHEFTERQMWEAILILDDDSLLLTRFSQGNTGVLRQQAALRSIRFHHYGPPQEYLLRGRENDARFDSQSVHLGSQSLTYDNRWHLRIRDSLFNIQAVISSDPSSFPVTLSSDIDWTTTLHALGVSTQGWMQINEFSTPISGHALIFEHSGHRVHPSERDLWIIESSQTTWLIQQSNQDSQVISLDSLESPVKLDVMVKPESTVPLQDVTLHLQKAHSLGSIDTYEHISGVERLLVSSVFPTPHLQVSSGFAEIEHASNRYPARFFRIQYTLSPSD